MALNQIDTAERLLAWMLRMNLTPTTAAKHLGHRRATISRYANGTQPVPEHVSRQAAIVEASRNGQPFESQSRNVAPSSGNHVRSAGEGRPATDRPKGWGRDGPKGQG